MKKGPKSLSLPGSLVAIDKAAFKFSRMIQDDSYMDTGHDDVLRDFISDMKGLRSKLDQRTKQYADSYEELATYLRMIRGRKTFNAQIEREFRGKLRQVGAERRKLIENREIREELMLE